MKRPRLGGPRLTHCDPTSADDLYEVIDSVPTYREARNHTSAPRDAEDPDDILSFDAPDGRADSALSDGKLPREWFLVNYREGFLVNYRERGFNKWPGYALCVAAGFLCSLLCPIQRPCYMLSMSVLSTPYGLKLGFCWVLTGTGNGGMCENFRGV